MGNITVLDQHTIDKIAAGEVIERPASIVKELVENSIDAGATAVTVEIKEGGISFVRITDNGMGISKEEVPIAFLRHATSKIKSVEDLLTVNSLGFRGEALSSIAAVCQVELITKTPHGLTGVRYVIEGSKEKNIEDIGAPEGTTFLVRNLFYNTPARKKFLKSAVTEAGYISELLERLALSHPDISFKFINNNQIKLHTSGNTNLKDIIYGVYGRDIANYLLEIRTEQNDISINGYIGKPNISRGNRNYENYYINGRYIKSSLISKAIEDAYKPFVMQHKYPFTALHIRMAGELLDVNVHPTKMELRFSNQVELYNLIVESLKNALSGKELIPQVSLDNTKSEGKETPRTDKKIPEPFEKNRLQKEIEEKGEFEIKKPVIHFETDLGVVKETTTYNAPKKEPLVTGKQLELFEEKLLTKEAVVHHDVIGQVFDTYWIVQFKEKMYMIDQHAAHEKVLYERMVKELKNKEFTSQQISPPIILTLSMQEETLLKKYMKHFTNLGFVIEAFGGKEYAVSAIPGNLYYIAKKDLLIEILDSLSENIGEIKSEMIDEKLASMACKAAVKGNSRLSHTEVKRLIDELLTLENPYHCPHGRPIIVSMTKYEIEKKFKRIV
jgi:DNA mismatch repair protein MutL